MKYIKIFLVASLTLFGLASCGPKDAGTVGDATVDFYSDNLEGGFASDFLMVPIVLSNNEETTADVTLTVKPAEYTGAFAGKVDEDFMLTTENMVFKPGVDSINLEVMILNKDVDELRFMLEIAETNATAGVKDKILVSLAKSDLDRICTTWEWNVTSADYLDGTPVSLDNKYTAAWLANPTAQISWDSKKEMVTISNFEDWGANAPLYAHYDAEKNQIVWPSTNFTNFGDSAAGMYLFQVMYVRDAEGVASIAPTSSPVTTAPNDDYTALEFSTPDAGLCIVWVDGATSEIVDIYTYRYWGLRFTKPVSAAVAAIPSAAVQNVAPKMMASKAKGGNVYLLDIDRINLENQVIEYLNANL
ncbi:MAG: hypothetical protein IIX17_04590 [Tidjanibacter sp.]|nr:hypothetical protein [Tidjanibacter sp.]